MGPPATPASAPASTARLLELTRYSPSKERFDELAKQFSIVPVWTEVIADLETPVSTYMKLVQGADPASPSFLLESVEHGERWGRYSFVGVDPFLVMTSHGGKVELKGHLPNGLAEGTPLEKIRELLSGELDVGAKVQEEAEEVVRAAGEETDDRVASEAADVLYHLTVLLHRRELSVADAAEVLNGRRR